MREQLRQYVELLFAGAPDSDEIKEEILQNTLDRYDDLIAQGKVPEAAYRLAITGIGDIQEILGSVSETSPSFSVPARAPEEDAAAAKRRRIRAIAIGLYIVCIMPLIVLSELGLSTLSLCATLSIVAVATVAMIQNREPDEEEQQQSQQRETHAPRQELRKSISSLLGIVTLIVYLIVSFATGAWYITWLIFPLSGAVKGLIKAILDLKEAVQNEI